MAASMQGSAARLTCKAHVIVTIVVVAIVFIFVFLHAVIWLRILVLRFSALINWLICCCCTGVCCPCCLLPDLTSSGRAGLRVLGICRVPRLLLAAPAASLSLRGLSLALLHHWARLLCSALLYMIDIFARRHEFRCTISGMCLGGQAGSQS